MDWFRGQFCMLLITFVHASTLTQYTDQSRTKICCVIYSSMVRVLHLSRVVRRVQEYQLNVSFPFPGAFLGLVGIKCLPGVFVLVVDTSVRVAAPKYSLADFGEIGFAKRIGKPVGPRNPKSFTLRSQS